jgi:hypothetical protein
MYPLSDWLVRAILKNKPAGLPADATVESIKALLPGPLYGTVLLYDKEPEGIGSQLWGSRWQISVDECPVFVAYDKETQALHYDRMDGHHTTYTTFIPSWETLDVKLFYQDNKTAFLFYTIGYRPDATLPQDINPETQLPLEYESFLVSGEPHRTWKKKLMATQWVFGGRF